MHRWTIIAVLAVLAGLAAAKLEIIKKYGNDLVLNMYDGREFFVHRDELGWFVHVEERDGGLKLVYSHPATMMYRLGASVGEHGVLEVLPRESEHGGIKDPYHGCVELPKGGAQFLLILPGEENVDYKASGEAAISYLSQPGSPKAEALWTVNGYGAVVFKVSKGNAGNRCICSRLIRFLWAMGA